MSGDGRTTIICCAKCTAYFCVTISTHVHVGVHVFIRSLMMQSSMLSICSCWLRNLKGTVTDSVWLGCLMNLWASAAGVCRDCSDGCVLSDSVTVLMSLMAVESLLTLCEKKLGDSHSCQWRTLVPALLDYLEQDDKSDDVDFHLKLVFQVKPISTRIF